MVTCWKCKIEYVKKPNRYGDLITVCPNCEEPYYPRDNRGPQEKVLWEIIDRYETIYKKMKEDKDNGGHTYLLSPPWELYYDAAIKLKEAAKVIHSIEMEDWT